MLATGIATGIFDEDKIVASFGVMSDTHINGVGTDPGIKLKKALEQLKAHAALNDEDGLDGILIAGDLIDSAYRSEDYYKQMDMFSEIYKSVLDPMTVKLAYSPGNHDVYKEWTPDAIAQAQKMSARLDDEFFCAEIEPESRKALECRHYLINDVHILGILPIGRAPVVYTDEQIAWLDSRLAELTQAEPDRYVLVLTHPMIHGTVYGSLLGNYWETEALTETLEKYPQAVTFSGHLHFPLNDPRSVWQGRFTAFGCGSVRYMAIEDGGYENMAGKTIMRDANEFSQGLLVQIDEDGNLKATRMDFYNNRTIGEPWIICHPMDDNSHLWTYSHKARAAANKAPQMKGIDISKGIVNSKGMPLTVSFPAGVDDEFVHHYVITVSDGDKVIRTKKILADFYRADDPSEMKSRWSQALGEFKPGEYTVSIVALDSWDAQSAPATQKITIPDFVVDVPVAHDWVFEGRKACKLDVNVSGSLIDGKKLDLTLIRDLSLMSEVKDTVLVRSKRIKAKAGKAALSFNLGRLEPGFYQVNLSEGPQIYKRFNIGVNPEKIVSPQDKRPDFDEFWEKTLAELAMVPFDAKLTVDKAHSNDVRTTYLVTMKSFGGETMGGILCMPNKPGRYNTFIDYLGYGANPIWYDPSANPETVEFLVSVRDQGTLKRQGHYRWIDRGLDCKENFYYRGAFCDVVRAIDFVSSLDNVDPEHLYARGESQGGAFTLISVSLDHRIKACAPSVPFLSDFEHYSQIVPWPMQEVIKESKSLGIAREDLFEMLSYFDVKNFVDRIQCPVYMAFGLQDGTCPPHTNFAGYNLITAPKKWWCAPENGHETWALPEWFKARAEFFKPFLK